MTRPLARLALRKPVAHVRRHLDTSAMRRSLGPLHLTMIGIGCIVGAGIYVMVGAAAADHAGPAVVLYFLIAALACALVCLCYAELASVLPAPGASYTYAYTVLGEGAAWIVGWMLMLEFTLAGAALASGFSGYLVSLLHDFGIPVPAAVSTPYVQSVAGAAGTSLARGGGVNLIAVAALLAVTLVLVRGVTQSAAVNALLVIVKVGVLIGFVVAGAGHVDPHNWTPFVPPGEGGFRFGEAGVLRAASILFFAYLGFEAVANAASEARAPQRDVPIGMLTSLLVSAVLYPLVALVMTGLVPFRALGVPDPIAVAVSAIGMPMLAVVIKTGALAGLASVLLVNTYAQSRVLFAIAADGLLPVAFARLDARLLTPVTATATVAAIAALCAALLPIAVLADLVSLGTVCIFSVVALAVMGLRTRHPELDRPFRVPLGGVWIGGMWIGTVPVLALAACALMALPLLLDIIAKAGSGEWIPLVILATHLVAGGFIYRFYGMRHATLPAD